MGEISDYDGLLKVTMGSMDLTGRRGITPVPLPIPTPSPEEKITSSGESLHDDFGMHEYAGVYAQMVDGRVVQLALHNGHMEIVDVLDGGPEELPSPASDSGARETAPTPEEEQKREAKRQLADSLKQVSKIKRDATEGTDTKSPGGGHGAGSDQPEDATGLGDRTSTRHDPVFLAQLTNVMNDNQFDRRLRGRTRGKLDMTRLYKAQTGSLSVFTQKSLRKNKQYNVVLVVDESGSMGMGTYSRLEFAAQATQFLAVHLNRIPGVNLAVVGFNHNIRVHKELDSKIDLNTLEQTIYKAALVGGGCNADYAALEKAYELVQNREGQNLVIFTSDGEPAGCGSCAGGKGTTRVLKNGSEIYTDDHEELNALVNRHGTLAKTVGVGIETVARQVPHNIKVGDLRELKSSLIGILRKEMQRG